MNLHLTASAAQHFSGILKRYPDAVGIRFGVKPSGCAQYKYVIDVASAVNSTDNIIESNGVKMIVDNDSLEKIADTEIDYQQQGLNSTLVFHNPHAHNACGCGESFSLL